MLRENPAHIKRSALISNGQQPYAISAGDEAENKPGGRGRQHYAAD